MTREQLTPEEIDQIQVILLRRWLALRFPKGTRRRTDGAGPVKCYDSEGKRRAPS